MNPVIEYIVKTHKITDYLDKLGHKPYKSLSRGRLTYLCPFPNHKELKPSFYVWTDSEYQNFHCFGCGRNYSIIHLVSILENISTKQAVMKLSEGLDLSNQVFNLDMILDSLKTEYAKQQQSNVGRHSFEEIITSISSMCLSHLEGVGYRDSEIDIVDKFYCEVDTHIYNYDIAELEELLYFLPDVLLKRREKIEAQIAAEEATVEKIF